MSLALKLKKNKRKEKRGVNTPRRRPVNKFITTAEKVLRNIANDKAEKELPLASIKQVTFSVFEKEIIKRLSVCQINNLNSAADPNNSLSDPRMGTIESYHLCATCGRSNDSCPGHLAIMPLSADYIHPFYRQDTIKVLSCFCHTCNKLLISEQSIKDNGFDNLKGEKKLKAIYEYSKKLNCSNPDCAAKPVFKDRKPSESGVYDRSVPYIIKTKDVQIDSFMSVKSIKYKLDTISDKDAKILGFTINHPRNFIIDYLPIIPLNDRPYNQTEKLERKDHDITKTYREILQKVLESLHYENEDKQEECYKEVLRYYSLLIKNSNNDSISRKDPPKSITEMLQNKEGLIRNHMMGKRCDYTGRTVLGSNRNLNFGYIALPERMRAITLPEIITPYNRARIIDMAKKGQISYFCPRRGNLANCKIKFNLDNHLKELSIGDRVDRCVMEGDYVLFNRQPTLHRHSLLGYNITFQDKLSIGLHLSSTNGHNADFDGDEGNLHFMQTFAAQVEARMLMSSVNYIINSGGSVPESALVYNSLTGAYLLTSRNYDIPKKKFMEAIDYVESHMKNNYVTTNLETLDKRLGGIKKYSSYGLCSVLFPEDFWFMRKGDQGLLHIYQGVIHSGILSEFCGTKSNGIVQTLLKKYGSQTAASFISAAEFLFNWVIYHRGFTVGIKDIMIKGENRNIFDEEREKIIRINDNELINMEPLNDNADSEKIDEREYKISVIAQKTGDRINKYFAKNILDKSENSINIMAVSGAKGGASKLYNVISSKAQIFLAGSMPAKNMSNNKRWISSFHVDDRTLYSRGFSKNGYFEGISPDAFFADSEAGRLGIIDTAVKTQEVGYQSRKMVKAMEDLVCYYNGSVCNQNGIIFQFSYGSGFDPKQMVIDESDNYFNVFSFINIKNLCGDINSKNGFHNFNLAGAVKSIAKDINDKYNFIDESANNINNVIPDNEDEAEYLAEEEEYDIDFDD